MEFNRAQAVYVYNLKIDMRSSYDRLSQLVESSGLKSRSGSYFVFIGRNKKKVKVLYWDKDGYCIWQKRLEAGIFKIGLNGGVDKISVSSLSLILSGMEYERIKVRNKFSES